MTTTVFTRLSQIDISTPFERKPSWQIYPWLTGPAVSVLWPHYSGQVGLAAAAHFGWPIGQGYPQSGWTKTCPTRNGWEGKNC